VSVQVSPSTLLSAHSPPTHKRLTVPTWLPLPVRAALMRLIEKKVLDKALGPALNDVRASVGLTPASRILGTWLHSTDGVLCLFPEWFAAPQPDWPHNHFLSGFPLFNDVAPDARDDELDDFLAAGPPPVVFTPGSTLIDQQAYFQAVGDALQSTGIRAILLASRTASPRLESPQVLARQFAPMQTLLPRCAAIVHHGGIGTAALAFASGIPQVVTAFAHDQFDNAQRVARTGCGVRVDGPASGRSLVSALARVTGDATIAARCVHAKRQIDAAPNACLSAAQYIERFAPPVRADAGMRVSG
jgi:rhamnosyltransferase subunit B